MKKSTPDQKKVIPFPASAIVRPPTVIVEGPQTRCTSEEVVRLLRELDGPSPAGREA